MASSAAKLPIYSSVGDNDVLYSHPREVGAYSIDGNRQHRNDYSQIKYLLSEERLEKPLNLDLKTGFKDTKHREYRCANRMNNILYWLIQKDSSGNHRKNVDFVTLRGTLQKIFCTPYVGLEKEIHATKFRNVIYFCWMDYPEESKSNDESLQQSSWGYKFEQYMTSAQRDGNADSSSNSHELEEFCIIVKSELGKHSLLFKAEIDAIDPAVSTVSTAKYVELKTCLDNKFKKTEGFYKKLLSCWAQCYLVGIDKIIFGLRDEEGIVTSLETMKMSDVERLLQDTRDTDQGKVHWKITKGKNFCNDFLSFLKTNVQEDNPAVVYRFYRTEDQDYIECQKLSDTAEPILPHWYIKNAEERNDF